MISESKSFGMSFSIGIEKDRNVVFLVNITHINSCKYYTLVQVIWQGKSNVRKHPKMYKFTRIAIIISSCR